MLLAGATGTIGSAVASALETAGHETVALVRSADAAASTSSLTSCQAIVHDLIQGPPPLASLGNVDAVISCLGSRTGGMQDAALVEYQANTHLLTAAEQLNAGRFILLSAICVQKPKLEFQRQKLRFEACLKLADIAHTIVRPTAYFKSLSGQLPRLVAGKPYLMFGDGRLTACKPISDRDLARFIVEQLSAPASENRVLPIGGPGPALSPKEQGELLWRAVGGVPRYKSVNPRLFLMLAGLLKPLCGISPWVRDRAEFMRIAHYYATESMLVWNESEGRYREDLTPEYGTDGLYDHYAGLLTETPDTRGANPHKLFS